MAEQLTFELPAKTAQGRDSFFVSAANQLAVKRLERWQAWPSGMLSLVGEAGVGKSHLAQVWASETGARVTTARDVSTQSAEELGALDFLAVEDVEQIAGDLSLEKGMFHLFNLKKSSPGLLLVTSRKPLAQVEFQLPDLKSRLSSLDMVRIDPPDDPLLAALLVKLFTDRQISVGPELIPYLVLRMDRSAAGVQALVATLDREALRLKRPITRRLAAEVLDNQGIKGA